MSSPSTTHDRTQPSTDSNDVEPKATGLERLVPAIATPIRVASFWTAIVLPFLHVPLLAAGLSTPAETGTFLGLLGLNLVTLYVGHSYRQ